MKQTDNRQKKQVQMRAASVPPKGGFFGAKPKEKIRIPEASSKDSGNPPGTSGAPPAPLSREPKIGRNAPCPCGSKKKYKKCCLLKSEGDRQT